MKRTADLAKVDRGRIGTLSSSSARLSAETDVATATTYAHGGHAVARGSSEGIATARNFMTSCFPGGYRARYAPAEPRASTPSRFIQVKDAHRNGESLRRTARPDRSQVRSRVPFPPLRRGVARWGLRAAEFPEAGAASSGSPSRSISYLPTARI